MYGVGCVYFRLTKDVANHVEILKLIRGRRCILHIASILTVVAGGACEDRWYVAATISRWLWCVSYAWYHGGMMLACVYVSVGIYTITRTGIVCDYQLS